MRTTLVGYMNSQDNLGAEVRPSRHSTAPLPSTRWGDGMSWMLRRRVGAYVAVPRHYSTNVGLAFLRALRRLGKSSYTGNLCWALISAIFSQGFQFCGSVATGRYLGRASLGQFGLIKQTTGVLGTFAAFGIGVTLTKYISQHRASSPKTAGTVIAASAVFTTITAATLSVGLVAFAGQIAKAQLHDVALTRPLIWGSALLFFSTINGVLYAALAGFERFRSATIVNVASTALAVPFVFFAAHRSVAAVLAALALQVITASVLTFIAVLRACKEHGIPLFLRIRPADLRFLWTFSTPTLFAQLLNGPVFWACSLLIVTRAGGYEELGQFNAANQFRTALIFVPGVLCQPLIARLSHLQSPGSTQAYSRLLCGNAAVALMTAAFLGLLVICFRSNLMAMFGRHFVSHDNILDVIVIGSTITAVSMVLNVAMVSNGHAWLSLAFQLVWAALMIGGTWLHLALGARGLALAMAESYLCYCILTAADIIRTVVERSHSPGVAPESK